MCMCCEVCFFLGGGEVKIQNANFLVFCVSCHDLEWSIICGLVLKYYAIFFNEHLFVCCVFQWTQMSGSNGKESPLVLRSVCSVHMSAVVWRPTYNI